MKKLILLIFLILSASLLGIDRIIPDLLKPYSLNIGDNNIFIFDGSSFSYKIYNLNNLKKIGEFGKKGEGPGEFRGGHEVTMNKDHLVICGSLSIFKFSKDGKLLKQSKKPPYVYLKPVNNFYIGDKRDYNQKDQKVYNVVYLYDQKFAPIKEIYRQFNSKIQTESKNIKKDMVMVRPYFSVKTSTDKVFIADSHKGFFIQIIDSRGNTLYSINKKMSKIKITREFKNKMMKREKSSKMWIENKRNFNYIFPEHFNDIKDFSVDDEKIYVITHFKKDGKNQLLIMDFKGKILKTTFIPFKSRLSGFKNGKYFYLEDIEDDWKISSVTL